METWKWCLFEKYINLQYYVVFEYSAEFIKNLTRETDMNVRRLTQKLDILLLSQCHRVKKDFGVNIGKVEERMQESKSRQ